MFFFFFFLNGNLNRLIGFSQKHWSGSKKRRRAREEKIELKVITVVTKDAEDWGQGRRNGVLSAQQMRTINQKLMWIAPFIHLNNPAFNRVTFTEAMSPCNCWHFENTLEEDKQPGAYDNTGICLTRATTGLQVTHNCTFHASESTAHTQASAWK